MFIFHQLVTSRLFLVVPVALVHAFINPQQVQLRSRCQSTLSGKRPWQKQLRFRNKLVQLTSRPLPVKEGTGRAAFAAPRRRVFELSSSELVTAFLDTGRVATLTYYKGTEPPVEYLRTRVSQVVRANPWLSATFARRGLSRTAFDAEYLESADPAHPNVEVEISYRRCFDVLPKRDLRRMLVKQGRQTSSVEGGQQEALNNYAEIFEGFRDAVGPGARETIARAEQRLERQPPVFRVALIPGLDDDFVVVASLDHSIGDANTFYAVQNMLSDDTEVRSLSIARRSRAEFAKVDRQLFRNMMADASKGGRQLPWLPVLPPPLASLLFGKKKLFATEVNLDTVGREKINFLKRKVSRSAPFVSNNDVLMSSILRTCRPDLGLMAVNLRGKLAGVEEGMAGSYITFLYFGPKDYARPEDIRNAVATNRILPRSSVQGFAVDRIGARICLVTNWAGFAEDVVLRGCKPVIHLPMIDMGPGDGIGCVIFRPAQGRIGAVFGGRDVDNNKLNKLLFTGPLL